MTSGLKYTVILWRDIIVQLLPYGFPIINPLRQLYKMISKFSKSKSAHIYSMCVVVVHSNKIQWLK